MSNAQGPDDRWISPVGEPDKIDVIGARQEGGADLLLVVSRPLEMSPAHLDVFCQKFRNYCQYVKAPEFAQEFGPPSRDRVQIIVRSNWEVPEPLMELMDQIVGEEMPPAEITVWSKGLRVDRTFEGMPQRLPVCHPLSPGLSASLDRLRAMLRRDVKKRYGLILTGLEEDLSLLQRVVDDQESPKDQMAEIHAVGVYFGDILARKLEMTWVFVTATWLRDVGLRYKNSGIIVFPESMLVKRAEEGVPIDLASLFAGAVQGVEDMIKSGKYGTG